MKRENTRDLICESAMRLAARDGLLTVTLDNVAREAGLSKGGVTHHFASKEELFGAVIEHYSRKLNSLMLSRIAADPEPRFRHVRAMLEICFDLYGPNQKRDKASRQIAGVPKGDEEFVNREALDRFMLAILTLAVHKPDLIEPVRAIGKSLRENLTADRTNRFDELLYWLAADGIFLWRFVGLIEPDDPLYHEIGCRADAANLSTYGSRNAPGSSKRNQTAKGKTRDKGCR